MAQQSEHVVALVHRLVQHLVFGKQQSSTHSAALQPGAPQSEATDSMVSYALRVLSARMTTEHNYFALSQQIVKHLQRRGGPGGSGTADALRYSELAVQLRSHSQTGAGGGGTSAAATGSAPSSAYLRDEWPITYVLYKLADRAAFRNASSTPAIASASSLFAGAATGYATTDGSTTRSTPMPLFAGSTAVGLPTLPSGSTAGNRSSVSGLGGLKLKPKATAPGGNTTASKPAASLPPGTAALDPFSLYNFVAGPSSGGTITTPTPSPFIGHASVSSSTDGKLLGRAKASAAAELSEERLVRDLIYTFQGIDGQFVKFDSKRDGYFATPAAMLSDATHLLVRRIAELGWMYRRVCAYVNACLDAPSVGLVEQSFCGALQQELTDYYRLIAVFEAQVTQHLAATTIVVSGVEGATTSSTGSVAISTTGATASTGTATAAANENQFTLRRLFVWIQDPLERMRLMAILADAAKGLKGGALVSAIASFLRHGDPFVVGFVRRMMRRVCKPVFEMIRMWVFGGELRDPFSEFFIAANAEIPKDRLWREKYRVRRSMLPAFIDPSLANQILVIGKSINFIRHVCQDTKWSPEAAVSTSGAGATSAAAAIDGLAFTDDDLTPATTDSALSPTASASSGGSHGSSASGSSGGTLATLVDAVARVTNQRLLQLLLETHRFAEHCLAIKKYLLLGQGDFIAHLLSLLHTELNKPAKEIYAHNLLDTLTVAEHASNAQFEDVEFLKRLSVRYLKAEDGDSGWDIFSLDYKIADSPLSVVLTEQALSRYLRVFNFLWRLKRVEHTLASAWRKGMSHVYQHKSLQQTFGPLLRQGHVLRHAMWHFVQNLSSYLMFEVLETSFQTLSESLAGAGASAVTCLDDLIAAHEHYLTVIVDRALMDRPAIPPSAGAAGGAAGGPARLTLNQLLTKIFHVIIEFGALQDRIHGLSVGEAARVTDEQARIYKRTAAGKWGTTAADRLKEGDVDGDDAAGTSAAARELDIALGKCGARLNEIDTRYHDLLFEFLDALLHQPTVATVASLKAQAAAAAASAAQRDSKADAAPSGNAAAGLAALNSGGDLTPLAFRLDFNGFYAAHRERIAAAAAASPANGNAAAAPPPIRNGNASSSAFR